MRSMDSNRKKKQLKNDRISKLPDSILSNILSRLPFKNAMAATTLSTRWKNLFPFPISLILDDILHSFPKDESSAGSSSFVDFVDKLLKKIFSQNTCVHHLTFRCRKDYGDAKIISWVRAAVRLSVQQLIFEVSLNDSMTLFDSLDGCATLRILRFWGINFELCVPDNFSLPNLKMLFLGHVTFSYDKGKSINELISGCHVLEDLSLWQCNLQSLGILCIRSNRLKTLLIYNCWIGSTCCLLLDAPNLKRLSYDNSSEISYTLSKFKSLEYASIDVRGANGVAKIVDACSGSISLCLSRGTSEALQDSIRPLPLPVFSNLTSLELSSLGFGGGTLLARLLWNAPNLKKLILGGFCESLEGLYADFESSLPTSPICLERHIKNIEFGLFEGPEEDEMRLVNYFVENGKVLEKLELYGEAIHRSMLQKLFTLPSHCRSKIHIRPSFGEGGPLDSFSQYMWT